MKNKLKRFLYTFVYRDNDNKMLLLVYRWNIDFPRFIWGGCDEINFTNKLVENDANYETNTNF